jgi:hypothetical protein
MPLVNIEMGNWAEPATALINHASNAVGGLARPWQIRRVARAQGDARIIDAKATIEITDLEHRAILRHAREEGQHQDNMERITYLAASRLSADAKPEQISVDWLRNFYRNARHISGDAMQQVWASVLAKKSEQAADFSPITLDILSKIDEDDAAAFEKICSLTLQFDTAVPYIFSLVDNIYLDNGINFDVLNNLDKIGVINIFPSTHLFLSSKNMPFKARYFQNELIITKQFKCVREAGGKYSIGSGHATFTRAGRQLSSICQTTEIPGFFDYASDRLLHGHVAQLKVTE